MSIASVYTTIISGAILLLPLIIFPGIENRYEQPRFFLFVTVSFICFLLTFVHTLKHGTHYNLFNKIVVLLIAYVMWVLFCDVVGLDTKTSLLGSDYRMQGFLSLLSGLLLSLSLLYFRSIMFQQLEKKIHRILLISLVSVITVGSVQIVLLYLDIAEVVTFDGRLLSTFGNPNFFAGYVAGLFPLLLFLRPYSRKIAALKSVSIILCAVTVYFSESRSGIVSLTILSILYVISRFSNFNRYKIIKISTVLLVLFIGLWSMTQLNRNSPWDDRLMIWKTGLNAAYTSPLVGYGQENFALIYPPELHHPVDSAHNIFLEVLIASGIPGLLLFFLILCLVFKDAPHVYRFMLIGWLIGGFFNPISIVQYVLLFVIVGLSLPIQERRLTGPGGKREKSIE